MLEPDIKSQLLYNPSLMKNLEVLERSQPVNSRVADIKKFI